MLIVISYWAITFIVYEDNLSFLKGSNHYFEKKYLFDCHADFKLIVLGENSCIKVLKGVVKVVFFSG